MTTNTPKFGKLLGVSNAKTSKGEAMGYLTGILYMTPARAPQRDGLNLCPYSTAGCRASCLFTAGRGAFSSVVKGRARKRALFVNYRAQFVQQLDKEITALEKRARREGMRLAIRLNGTTDIDWLAVPGVRDMMERHSETQFYDYTKDRARVSRAARIGAPSNYDVTFSYSGRNDAAVSEMLSEGARVAVVFDTRKGAPLPKEWKGYPIIDGDAHDLRFLEEGGVVVGLRAKGKAKKDMTGFVVRAV